MEKKKLKLKELEINSFVTKVEKNEKATLDGGAIWTTILSVISIKVTWDAIDSLLYGDCPTKGDGILCEYTRNPVPISVTSGIKIDPASDGGPDLCTHTGCTFGSNY